MEEGTGPERILEETAHKIRGSSAGLEREHTSREMVHFWILPRDEVRWEDKLCLAMWKSLGTNDGDFWGGGAGACGSHAEVVYREQEGRRKKELLQIMSEKLSSGLEGLEDVGTRWVFIWKKFRWHLLVYGLGLISWRGG